MSRTRANTDSTTFPRRVKRVIAGALSTMLAAGGLVAISVAAPVVSAPSANAAVNFQCGTPDDPQLYLTSNVNTGTQQAPNFDRRIFGLDAADAVTTLAYTPSPLPTPASQSLNQLALTRGGAQMLWTNATNVYEYTPGGVEGTPGVLETTPRPGGALTGSYTMGGFDIEQNRYVYGVATGTTLTLNSYDPATNTIVNGVARVNLTGAPGGNGDLAFAPDGTMFVVAGGSNASAQNPGVDAAQLYRVTGGIGTTAAPGTAITHDAVSLGEQIPNIRGLNSIAFGADGFLYLFGSSIVSGSGPTATVTPQLIQVNPSSGQVVDRQNLTGATSGATDFASCATPSTATGSVTVPAPANPNDSFDVVVSGPDTPATETGNRGSTGPIPAGGEGTANAGPILVLPGQQVRVDLEPGPGTDLGDYDPSWQCVDTSAPGSAPVSAGFGSTAFYTQPNQAPEGATVACEFATAGGLTLDKTSDVATVDAVGDTITYTFTASNTSLAPVSNASISDTLEGLSALSCTPAQGGTIPAGGSISCTATRDAVASDFTSADPIVNQATASGTVRTVSTTGVEGTRTLTAEDSVTVQPDRTLVVAPPASSLGNAPGEPVTVSVAPGVDYEPGTIRIVGGDEDGKQLTVPEGVWTVDDENGTIVFTPNGPNVPNPAPIQYTVDGANGLQSAPAAVTVGFAPTAVGDVSNGNELDEPVVVPVLANDAGPVDPGTLQIFDPVTEAYLPAGESLVVAGQGTWSIEERDVDGEPTTVIVFTPQDGYTGNPTPITYQVGTGNPADAPTSATVSVTYTPEAVADEQDGFAAGEPIEYQPLTNDRGVIDPASFQFIAPGATTPLPIGQDLVVDGEGTWSYDPATGTVTFDPDEGFFTDPTPVGYQIAGPGGSSQSTITLEVLPLAVDDADLGNTIGDEVALDILANDFGDLDPASVVFVDADGNSLGTTLAVDGEGVWTYEVVDVDGVPTGRVTFDPDEGFLVDPAPVSYRVIDADGQSDVATITVTYVPSALDDEGDVTELTEIASVEPLANDTGEFDVSTFTFLDAAGDPVGAGQPYATAEGVWSIIVVGDVVTVEFDPADGFEADPTPVDYEITDVTGDTVSATISMPYQPVAVDDAVPGQQIGAEVIVPVLGNDRGSIDPDSIELFDPAANDGEGGFTAGPVVIPGQGTWTVETRDVDGTPTPVVVFTPEIDYQGDPDPIDYQVTSPAGVPAQGTVTVTVLPVAGADEVLLAPLTEPGTPVVVEDILGNDTGVLAPGSVQLFDPNANDGEGAFLAPGAPLVVPGQGTWSIVVNDDDTVDVVFEAEAGFQGDPTPIQYQAIDGSGDTTQAGITVTFQPVANPDSESGFVITQPASVTPLANDLGAFVNESFTFVPAAGTELEADGSYVVDGQGTWSSQVDPETGVLTVTFSPATGYQGDPSPVGYEITDGKGATVGSTITVDYQPEAAADESLDNEVDTTVTVEDVLVNDLGVFDPATFAFVPAGSEEPLAAGDDYVVEGEGTWSIVVNDDGTVDVVFAPETGFQSDPTPVAYVVEDLSGSQTGSTITVDYLQVANSDENLDQPITEAVTVEDILGNDDGAFVPESVQLYDPATQAWLEPGADLVVAGEGTWSIVVNDDGTVDVTFEPLEGYLGDPTPVQYQAQDVAGDLAQSTITVSYLPVANDDESLAHEFQEIVTIDVLANDVGDFLPATVALFDPAAAGGEGAWLEPGVSLVVAGQGTWSIDQETGAVTFTPEPGYGGDPDVVRYQVTDSTGDTVEATITVTYGATAVDDESLRNAQGTSVTVDVLANDLGQFDPASVRIVDGEELVTTLVVAGQGTWTVDTTTGSITFTPADGFTGNPTPIAYQVTDVSGDVTGATVTITYVPQANDDRSEGNAPGTAVTVDPLANDAGDLDPTTVEILDPQTGEWGKTVVVPGEGTWTVDPVTGEITFTPEDGFAGDPTPIRYRVTDVNGEVTYATVTIDYEQVAGIPGLPQTGAELTLGALLAGLAALLVGAGVWLVRRRRAEGVDA